MNMNQLKETIENIETMSPDTLNALIEQTVSAFHIIQAKVGSTNQEERHEGIEVAKELKMALESQLLSLQDKIGMDSTQIEAYLTNPDNFSAEELRSMDEARNQLAQFST